MNDYNVLKINSDEFFESKNYDESSRKNALVIIPDLSLNGAQTVMFELLKIIAKMGYAVTIISSEDGLYRKKYTDFGARVVIRSHVSCDESFKDYMRENYDFIFLNSSSCLPYLYFFINTKVKTILWLHESEEQLLNTKTLIPHPQLLSPNITILGVTNKVRQGIKNIYNCDIDVMPMPIQQESESCEKSDERVMFFIPAAYTFIKGQDILLSSISRLPEEMIQKSQFVFCGYTLDGQKDYYDKIRMMGERLPNVAILDALDRDEVYDYYRKCDCVIAPSRIDSTPTSIVEAMMFRKLVMVSTGAGISEYLTDCENGFLFSNEDELFQRLLLVISDLERLGGIAEKGHEVYRNFFSPDQVEKILSAAIK